MGFFETLGVFRDRTGISSSASVDFFYVAEYVRAVKIPAAQTRRVPVTAPARGPFDGENCKNPKMKKPQKAQKCP